MTMKRIHLSTILAAGLLAVSLSVQAEDKKADPVKPYTLPTCIITGEKLGEMGSAYVFTNSGREIKLCCKACFKEFNKDPKKYIKKIEEAEAEAKAKAEKTDKK